MTLLFLIAVALGPDIDEDFEDALPDGWERVSSDAHPPYNTIEILRDPKSAKSGDHFLRLTTMGGSTGYRLSPRRGWTVDASRPYRLSAFARLTSTRRNVAVVTLTWLNAAGDPIADVRSAPVAAPGTWTEIVLDLARVPAGAVAAAPSLDFEGDDVRGLCDFDRLSFGPVERLDLRPDGRATAVFAPEEYPRLAASIAGAAPGSHGITVRMAGSTRSVVVAPPLRPEGTVDFLPPGPGAHEALASIDGRNVERRLAVLVPNPWPSTGEPLPEIPAALLQAAVRGPLEDGEGRPTPAWLARRALHDVLQGAAPMADPGFFPAGVRVAAFRKKDSAALALWTDAGEFQVPVGLNDGAKVYPLLGAIRPLRPGERLTIGPLPTFLIGIDPLLLEMRLGLSGPDLPLQLNPSTRTLRLRNPSRSQALRDVRVKVVEIPAGWRVSPLAIGAPSIAADGELAEDLQFALPPTETARLQSLTFEVSFVRDGKERTVRLSRPVRLGAALAIDASVSDGSPSGSKRVTVRITNASDRPMTLLMRARIPQHPEQNEILRDLAPGATSSPFTYVVKDVPLLDPAHVTAEIDVRESVGARAAVRRLIPLR